MFFVLHHPSLIESEPEADECLENGSYDANPRLTATMSPYSDNESNEITPERNHTYINESDEHVEKSKKPRPRSGNNLFGLTYTPQETFETRKQADEFIAALSIWKFQRTRRTKKGFKCFYGCKLCDMCKAKIYVLSHPDYYDEVTIFRNNIDHDHAQQINIGPASSTCSNDSAIDVGASVQIRDVKLPLLDR